MASKRSARSRLGLIAAALFVLGPALAALRLVPGLWGFAAFALGGILAVVVGLASVVGAVRGRGIAPGGIAAIVVGAVFLFVASRSAGVPAINDFTTDVGDPPAFHHAGTLGPNVGRDMSYPAAFAPIQQGCCADLHPARVRLSPKEAFARARGVAERAPAWSVTWADPDAGLLEAVATSRLFGFQDDVVIRVRPDGDDASRVDVRSKSRDGKGDLGTNAARIRTFVRDVEAGAP